MLSDSDSDSAGEVLSRFAAAVEENNKTANKPYNIEYSVGLKHFEHDTKKLVEEMIREADAAMYEHKNR
jgi:GGDEF domain-containing protein